ncbi:MAG: hypothetical protein IPM64_09610 [Phycisphaerales bacterium]|nr:hypothetical protein [Phycisphaerales bacterium]
MILRNWFCVAVVSTSVAMASATVSEWNGVNPAKWSYNPQTNTIEILAADSATFSFEAYNSGTGAPLDIDNIVVQSGVTGTVHVRIAPQPGSGRTYGAANVKGINLSAATTGNLAGVVISGDLGALTGVTVSNITGAVAADDGTNISVAGNLGAALTLNSATALNVAGGGTHTGDITIAGAGPHTGAISLTGDYSGDMTLTGDRSGQVKINGDLTSTGSVTITGEVGDRPVC